MFLATHMVYCFITARERRQQHDSRGDLSEDNRDFDGELDRPTQAVGFQTTKQLALPDPLPVRSTQA